MLLSLNDTLSNILGWVSIACWVVVYSPQILENYQLKSGNGLSVAFVVIWLLGDLCNLSGALLAGLLPTVIIIALYYTICDLILLGQIYYYRFKSHSITHIVSTSTGPGEGRIGEETPLIGENRTQEPISTGWLILRYSASLLFVFSTGVIAWWISTNLANNDNPKDPKDQSDSEVVQWVIQTLGWTSAVLYLGARLPQIGKNFKTRCEGLAPSLFFFSIFGNLTYTASICAKSMEKSHLIKNGGWFAGSALTVFLDVTVLFQFYYYRSVDGSRHV